MVNMKSFFPYTIQSQKIPSQRQSLLLNALGISFYKLVIFHYYTVVYHKVYNCRFLIGISLMYPNLKSILRISNCQRFSIRKVSHKNDSNWCENYHSGEAILHCV